MQHMKGALHSPALVPGAAAIGVAISTFAMAPLVGEAGTGALFAVLGLGWAMVGIAAWLLLKPDPTVYGAGAVASLAALGAWGWLRGVGLPDSLAANEDQLALLGALGAGLAAVFLLSSMFGLAHPAHRAGTGAQMGAAGLIGLSSLALVVAVPGSGVVTEDSTEVAATSPVATAPGGLGAVEPAAFGAVTDPESSDDAATEGSGTHDDHAHGSSTSHDDTTGSHAHGSSTSHDDHGTDGSHDHGTEGGHDDHPTDGSHDHGTEGSHDHPGDDGTFDPSKVVIDYGPTNRCDLGFNPTSYYRDATIAGVDFVNGRQPATTEAPHEMSEIQAAQLVHKLSTSTDTEYFDWLRGGSDDGHDHGSATAGGHDAHFGPQDWRAMTDPAQCKKLAEELALAREVAMRYPTAGDAKRAGYHQTTPYVNGIGAHYIKSEYIDGTFEVGKPEMLLFDGNGDAASIIGLSYLVIWPGPGEPPMGFTGRNDPWHYHSTLCYRNGITIGDSTMTKEQCEALGGTIHDGRNEWMSHAWVVPGCESPWGIFSQVSPLLDISLSNASGRSSNCQATGVRARYEFAPPVAPPSPYSYMGPRWPGR